MFRIVDALLSFSVPSIGSFRKKSICMSSTTLSNQFLIILPPQIGSDQAGYEFLCHVSLKTWRAKNGEVIFDFEENSYFQSNLCSPFGAIINFLKAEGNMVKFANLNPNIENDFRKNGFYDLIDSSYTRGNVLPTVLELNKFTLFDIPSFQQYIDDRLLGMKGFPSVSNLLKKKINSSILELFNNCHTHGKCEFVYTCGEFFPFESILRFTISDMGVTIRKNVNMYFKSGSSINGQEAIEWAVQRGHTTKKGAIPGGLGLSLIRDFLQLNGGAIQIISSNGYWEEKKGITFANTFKNRFLGTIVNLEFNLADTSTYVLSSEIDPKNVL